MRIGRRVGLTPEQIAHAGDDAWDGWSHRERVLLTAATQLVRDATSTTPTWAALRAHLDEAEAIELLMLCGQYDALATTLMTLRVQPEELDGQRPESISATRKASSSDCSRLSRGSQSVS